MRARRIVCLLFLSSCGRELVVDALPPAEDPETETRAGSTPRDEAAASPSSIDGDSGAADPDAWPPWPATDDSGCPQKYPAPSVVPVCAGHNPADANYAGFPCRQVSRDVANSLGRGCAGCVFDFVYPVTGEARPYNLCTPNSAGPAQGYDWFCCRPP